MRTTQTLQVLVQLGKRRRLAQNRERKKDEQLYNISKSFVDTEKSLKASERDSDLPSYMEVTGTRSASARIA